MTTVKDQLKEKFLELETEKEIDKKLKDWISDDSVEDIEEIAHLCREDYLNKIKTEEPETYI